MRIVVAREEEYAGILFRIFEQADGGIIPGHPYIAFCEEQRDGEWYAVARQQLPDVRYGYQPPAIEALYAEQIGIRGPFASMRLAHEANILWHEEMLAAMWQRFDALLPAAQREELDIFRRARTAKSLADFRALFDRPRTKRNADWFAAWGE